MPGPGPILRELHRIRRHIKDLEAKLEQGPRALKAQQMKLAFQEEQFKQSQDAVKHLKVKIHEKEVSVKASQQQIKKYETQIGDVKSKKEYDALKTEIAHSQASIRQIEDEMLELMGELDERMKALPAAEAQVQKARAEYAQAEGDHAGKLERFATEKERAAQELVQTEATLPEDAIAIYRRLVAAKGADALGGVRDKICVSCYTEITSQMSSEIRRDLLVLCRNCGRILYLEA